MENGKVCKLNMFQQWLMRKEKFNENNERCYDTNGVNSIINYVFSKYENLKPVIKYAESDSDCQFGFEYWDDRAIIVPKTDNEKLKEDKEWFYEFMMKYLYEKFDITLEKDDFMLFCILHEIGHYMTLQQYTEEEIENMIEQEYDDIKNLMEEDNYDPNQIEYLYREIKLEYMADEWAVDFIKSHQIGTNIINV